MATRKKSKKTATNSQSKSRRRHRTAEQMIADLEAEIERVKQRAVARELKESQAVKKTISVVRGIDKALEFAAEELKQDRDVVLAAVQNSWRALEFAVKELQQDREVVMVPV